MSASEWCRAALALIEAQLHAGLARGSTIVELGAFRLFRHPRADPFYVDMVVPRKEAKDWSAELEQLCRLVASGPLIELAAERWPGLVEAIEARGLATGEPVDRLPLMVLDRPPPAGGPRQGAALTLLRADVPAGTLDAYLRHLDQVQGGAGALVEGEIEAMAQALASGWVQELVEGEPATPVGGARLLGLPPVAELAAVWSDPAIRRQGHARARCVLLLRDFFARGGELVWLGAASIPAEALYRQLGFTTVGTHVSWRLPKS